MDSRVKKISFSVVAAVALMAVLAFATEVEFAPLGPAPLLNGKVGASEWQYPGVVESGWGTGHIWFKKDSQFVYLCVAPSDTVHSGLDMYIDNMAGRIFMLHVSSAHGQRFLDDTLWQDMSWGPADHWTSNLIEMIVKDGKTVWLAPEAFEFQIDRQLLPAETFKLMIHLKRPELWAPSDADTLSSKTWYWYGIDRPTGE